MSVIPLKSCSICKNSFPATSEFFPRRYGSLRSYCKACHRERSRVYDQANSDRVRERKRLYNLAHPRYSSALRGKSRLGITAEDLELLLFRQGGVCAVCRKPETRIDPRTGKFFALSIDHNHQTGQVRELLCHYCNTLLGYVENDLERVKKLVKYLKKHDS